MRKVLYKEIRTSDFTEKGWFHQFSILPDGNVRAIVEKVDGTIIILAAAMIKFVETLTWGQPVTWDEVRDNDKAPTPPTQEIYQVKPEDLFGDLDGFPIEVVQMMVQRQFEQTGKCDVRIFRLRTNVTKEHGGFTWSEAPEGLSFWNVVISTQRFDLFFKRYPK